jgi:hypothetical protein
MVDRTTTMGDKYGKKGLLQTKVTGNSKYSNVSSSLNTGKTAKNVTHQSDSLKAKRINEKFFRVSK